MRALLLAMAEGLPEESFIARIMGRRSFLAGNGAHLERLTGQSGAFGAAPWREGFQDGSEGWVRRALQHEHFHVFGLMTEPLRRHLLPFFWLEEVRTIGICLRNLGGSGAENGELLHWSLLGTPLRRALTAEDGILSGLERLTDVLSCHDDGFAGLPGMFAEGGAAAVEYGLRDISLGRFSRTCSHPAMRRYLSLSIDIANLTAIAKAWRWRLAELPGLIEGGSLRLSLLKRVATARDSAAFARLTSDLAGGGLEVEMEEPERSLALARKKVLAGLARGTDGIGLTMSYLWRCRCEAAAERLLSRRGVAGFDMIDRELAA